MKEEPILKVLLADPAAAAQRLAYLTAEKFLTDRHPRQVMCGEIGQAMGLGRLPSEYFYVANVEILDAIPKEGENISALRADDNLYRRFLETTAEKLSVDLVDETFNAFPCMPDGNLVFIINYRHPIPPGDTTAEAEAERELRARLRTLVRSARDKCRLWVRVWVTDPVRCVEGLRRTAEEIEWENLGVFAEEGKNSVIFYREIRERMLESPKGRTSDALRRMERGVISAAEEHNWDLCDRRIAQLIDLDVATVPACLRYRERVIDRLNCIYMLLGIPMSRADFPDLIAESWRSAIRGALSPEETKEIVSSVLAACKEYLTPPQKRAPISGRMEEILDFVEDNLSSPELSAAMISDEFAVSLSYLSRLFREQRDMKLIDYIHQRRVERSKELLQTHQTIDQIAVQVGYCNALTYSRAFKRVEGMTPGAYRRICMAQDARR